MDDLRGGEILFLISCTVPIGKDIRSRYGHVFVLHASDLPAGRGWSPHVWAILDGADELTLSLLEADDPVDSGAIWAKRRVPIPKAALHDEINAALFQAELALMSQAIDLVQSGHQPEPQSASGATYWPRRTPADSELDPTKPLQELFDLIRVADPKRFPAFFRLRGECFELYLKKTSEEDPDEN